MYSNTKRDKVRNIYIFTKISILFVEEKMQEIDYDNLDICNENSECNSMASIDYLWEVKRVKRKTKENVDESDMKIYVH